MAAYDIDNLYVDGSHLRLRRMVRRGGETQLKLTQKLPAPGPDGEQGALTTIYLSEPEHALLDRLPGARLRKVRLSLPPYGIDVFAPPLTGLVLAEVEFSSAAEARAFTPAGFCLAEVTEDARYTGARSPAPRAAHRSSEARRPLTELVALDGCSGYGQRRCVLRTKGDSWTPGCVAADSSGSLPRVR